MTEGVERAARAEDSVGLQISAEGYPDVSSHDSLGKEHAKGLVLSNEENEAVDLLGRLDFEYVAPDNANLTFRRTLDSRLGLPLSSRCFFPRAYVPMLLGQLGDKVVGHPATTGLMIPSRGYVELLCARIQPATAKRLFRLKLDESSDLDCVHKASASELACLPYHWPDEDGRQSVKRVHLPGRDGRPCLEISNASPLAGLLYGQMSESARVRLASPRIPLLVTLKMVYDPTSDSTKLAGDSEEAARSLIYELNVRNGVIIELVALPAGANEGVTRYPPEASKIRYPRAKLGNEVAIRFGFASQVVGDPPQAFLSYYQALEYFIPFAIRQSTFRNVRRELRDTGWDDESDTKLLRVVLAAEESRAAAEPIQLRIVINDYVRAGSLEEFFKHGWGNYFSSKGPIKDAPAVNLDNKGKLLSDQVADRVYHIRNRIVHAKDERKYKVLLPRSGEANALTPDVLLVRLLAVEAISAFRP